MVDRDTVDFIVAANLVECGIMPQPGGLHDQSNAFLQALRFFYVCKNSESQEDQKRRELEHRQAMQRTQGGNKHGRNVRR